MTLTKSTKNTHVYAADTEQSDAVISTLYVKKTAFGAAAPAFITVTIEEGQE